MALFTDEIDEGRRWSEQIADLFWRGISRSRTPGGGYQVAALAALDGVVPRCARDDVVLGLLRASVVAETDECMKHTVAAVELATANGLLQTVASEGSATMELIERSAWQIPPHGWTGCGAPQRSAPATRRGTGSISSSR